MSDTPDSQARMSPDAYRQTTLVYLLYALHMLFGVTALIGVIICHTRKPDKVNKVYSSHKVWQLWTFWAGLLGYSAGFYYWTTRGSLMILGVTFIWAHYRVAHGWWQARKHNAIGAAPPD